MVDMITGYRYGTDKNGKYWLVKLSALKEAKNNVPGFENEYFSDCCICESITEIETGKETESIVLHGFLRKPIRYTKGEKISGGRVWYCHEKEDLYKVYLRVSQDGKIYGPFLFANKMDIMITQVYGFSYGEVANEMNISCADLLKRIDMLKDGMGKKEDEHLYMPILKALLRIDMRKEGIEEKEDKYLFMPILKAMIWMNKKGAESNERGKA